MSKITNIKVSDTTYTVSVPYGTCSTAAGTAAKTVAITGFTQEEGTVVRVKFTNANTASNPTLNINSQGAKSIVTNGTTAMTTSWAAGSIVDFTYNGTSWVITNFGAVATTSLSVADSNDNADATITLSPSVTPKNTASATGNISLTATTSQPSTGYYIKAHAATADKTGDPATGKKKVSSGNGIIQASSKTVGASATATANAATADQYYILPDATLSITGGGLSGGGLTPGAGSVDGSNVELEGTNNSGVAITGSGSVSRAAVKRAAIHQKATLGVLPASDSDVIAEDSTTIKAASESSNEQTKYLKSFTIDSGKYLAGFTNDGMIGGSNPNLFYPTSVINNGTLNVSKNSGLMKIQNQSQNNADATIYIGQTNDSTHNKIYINAGSLQSGNPPAWTSDYTIDVSSGLKVHDSKGTLITDKNGVVIPFASTYYAYIVSDPDQENNYVSLTQTPGWLSSYTYLAGLRIDGYSHLDFVQACDGGSVSRLETCTQLDNNVITSIRDFKYDQTYGAKANITKGTLALSSPGGGLYVKAAQSNGYMQIKNISSGYALNLHLQSASINNVLMYSQDSSHFNALIGQYNASSSPSTVLESISLDDDMDYIHIGKQYGQLCIHELDSAAFLSVQANPGAAEFNLYQYNANNLAMSVGSKLASNNKIYIKAIADTNYMAVSTQVSGAGTPNALDVTIGNCLIKTLNCTKSNYTNTNITTATASADNAVGQTEILPSLTILENSRICAKYPTSRTYGGQGLIGVKAFNNLTAYYDQGDQSYLYVKTPKATRVLARYSDSATSYNSTTTTASANSWTYTYVRLSATNIATSGCTVAITPSGSYGFTSGDTISVGLASSNGAGATPTTNVAFTCPSACTMVIISVGAISKSGTTGVAQVSVFFIK